MIVIKNPTKFLKARIKERKRERDSSERVMQIPSSPNSTNILIRPGVLGINNVFFSSLLHPLTSRMETEARAKALAEQRNAVLFI